MTVPPASSPPEDAGMLSPDIDGLQRAQPPAPLQAEPVPEPAATIASSPVQMPTTEMAIAKKKVLLLSGAIYGLYIFWGLSVMAVLPSPTGELKWLVSLGLMSALIGACIFLGAGVFLFYRIKYAPDVTIANRQKSLLKAIVALVPGLLFSALLPIMILREPPMGIEITYPTLAEDLVAPVAVTVSVEKAVAILRTLDLRPVQYSWDTDGDGQENDRTVEPQTTVLFERQGAYTVVVRIVYDNGQFRRIARRIIIPRAVFSVLPPRPIVEKPVRFSVAHLLTDPKLLKEVQWDLDGDGQADEVSKGSEVLHTYYSVGRIAVAAVVLLTNNTQVTYKRTIDISDPPPLPFPVRLVTEPKNLIGSSPFGAIFRLETTEPIKEVQWTYGDGKEDRGVDVKRVLHLFAEPGIYPVVARVISQSGSIAELSTLVKVTEKLNLPDLQFDGSPEVVNNTISGEVPLTVSLTPKTSLPLVQFQWEADETANAQTSDSTINAVFRREGTYMLTLLAQDPEGKVFRNPIKVEVLPPSAEPAINARPDGGVAPLNVTFDASETFIPPGQKIAGFKWYFGDEAQNQTNNAEPGAARVEHLYTQPGTYTVQLSVVMATGKEFTAKRTIVIRRPILSSCITASRTRVLAGKGIEFDASCSTGSPVSHLWDVRYDAQADTPQAQSPNQKYIYVFQTPGAYTVSLTIRDRFGNEDRKTIAIVVDQPTQP